MAVELSVQERVLQAFLERVEESKAVPTSVVARLSECLSQGEVSAEGVLRIIREGVLDNAED